MRRLWQRFCRDRRGAIAVTSALLMTSLIGFAALGIDLGSVYTDKRKAQSVADLAALAAVGDMANAKNAAGATIVLNKLASASFDIQFGVYTADPAVAPASRFVPSAQSAANAARVLLDTKAPLFLSRAVTGRDHFDIRATATAAMTSFASFSIGSRLLKVDGGLLNAVLGGLLGAHLSLSAMDYNALIDMKLDAFDFMNALATRLQITAGTYDQVLGANVRIGDFVAAMKDTAQQRFGALNPAVRAMASVAQAVQGKAEKLKVQSVVDLGPYGSVSVGEKPKVSAMLAALDMITAAAQLANGENQVAVGIASSIPGIASATLKLSVGERPKGKSWATFGPAGATVHTAQTRVLLTVQVNGAAPLATVTIPIYIEIASGTARLASLKCGFPNVSTSMATLAVTPGVIDAWIGNVTPGDFTNFSRAPNPGPATLVDVATLKVTGRSHVSVSNLSPTQVTFAYSDILAQTKKTVGTSDFSASLVSRLLGGTQLGVNVLGLGLGLPQISSNMTALLSGAAGPVDQLLTSVLQTLGVGLGQVDVWVTGIRCDGAVLVI